MIHTYTQQNFKVIESIGAYLVGAKDFTFFEPAWPEQEVWVRGKRGRVGSWRPSSRRHLFILTRDITTWSNNLNFHSRVNLYFKIRFGFALYDFNSAVLYSPSTLGLIRRILQRFNLIIGVRKCAKGYQHNIRHNKQCDTFNNYTYFLSFRFS